MSWSITGASAGLTAAGSRADHEGRADSFPTAVQPGTREIDAWRQADHGQDRPV